MEMKICRGIQIEIDQGLINKNTLGWVGISEVITALESEPGWP